MSSKAEMIFAYEWLKAQKSGDEKRLSDLRNLAGVYHSRKKSGNVFSKFYRSPTVRKVVKGSSPAGLLDKDSYSGDLMTRGRHELEGVTGKTAKVKTEEKGELQDVLSAQKEQQLIKGERNSYLSTLENDRRRRARMKGKKSTILTGPLGATGASVSYPTLLGR